MDVHLLENLTYYRYPHLKKGAGIKGRVVVKYEGIDYGICGDNWSGYNAR